VFPYFVDVSLDSTCADSHLFGCLGKRQVEPIDEVCSRPMPRRKTPDSVRSGEPVDERFLIVGASMLR
jgi:hypothetical protein